MNSTSGSPKRISYRNWLQRIFILYVIFLSYLLIIDNPFAVVPIDEELVEEGFGLCLTPHLLSFIVLAILGLCARFRRPGWLYFGMFLYAGGTELLQGALNPWLGRCCDPYDFVENVQGLLFGGAGWWISQKCFHGKRSGRRAAEVSEPCETEKDALPPTNSPQKEIQDKIQKKSKNNRRPSENWNFGKNSTHKMSPHKRKP